MPELHSSICSATARDLFQDDGAARERCAGVPCNMLKIAATNTILYCEHWDACVHFYQHILGFKVSFAKDEWLREFIVTAGAYVSIANVEQCSILSGQGHGITLSWKVERLEQLRDSLLAQSVKVSAITSSSWRAPWFYAWDPEGHRIEFWQV